MNIKKKRVQNCKYKRGWEHFHITDIHTYMYVFRFFSPFSHYRYTCKTANIKGVSPFSGLLACGPLWAHFNDLKYPYRRTCQEH